MENDQMVFLMVEDNEHDILAVKRAWRENRIGNSLSESERDQLKAYDLLANAYVVKPMNFDNLSAAIKKINAFWQLASIPEDHDAESN
ncbi:MAG: hypothetical protein P8185_06930 [Deltaproteobacteria bacterium]|jgi:DNA-binding response OmpR family regulator